MSLPYVDHRFTKHITPNSIKTIVHLGANDGSDWKQLIETYSPSTILSFECNPKLIPLCEREVLSLRQTHPQTNIVFVPKAAFSNKQQIKFFSVNSDNSVDLGSSSIYKHQALSMEELFIDATTIDDECRSIGIDSIDLICADIEGGEINAFTNQAILDRTRYIMTEVGVNRNWKVGYPVLDDLKVVLEKYGFDMREFFWGSVGFAGEALFVNRKIQR